MAPGSGSGGCRLHRQRRRERAPRRIDRLDPARSASRPDRGGGAAAHALRVAVGHERTRGTPDQLLREDQAGHRHNPRLLRPRQRLPADDRAHPAGRRRAQGAVLSRDGRVRLPAQSPFPCPGDGHVAVHVVPRQAVRLAPGSLRGSALRRRDRDARGRQAPEGFANRVRRLVLGHGRLQQRAEPCPLGHPQNGQPGLLDAGPPPRLAPGNSQLRAHHPGDDLRLRESGPLRRRRNRLGSAPAERPGPHAGGNQLRPHRRRDGRLGRDRQGTQSRPASFRDAALWLRPHPPGRNRGEIRPRNRFRAAGPAAQLAPLRGSGRRNPASGSESLQGRSGRAGLPQFARLRGHPRGRPTPDRPHQDQALDLPLLRNRRRLPRAGHGAVPDRPRRYPRRDRAALRRHGLDAQGLERPFQHPDHRRPLPDRQPDQ